MQNYPPYYQPPQKSVAFGVFKGLCLFFIGIPVAIVVVLVFLGVAGNAFYNKMEKNRAKWEAMQKTNPQPAAVDRPR